MENELELDATEACGGPLKTEQIGQNMAPALISLHPKGSCVVVGLGAGLRVFDFGRNTAVAVVDDTHSAFHKEAIRAISFNEDGGFFGSAGDDKLVKVWNTETWSCIKTMRIPKKVTSLAFSKDSKWVLFADKFGVVYTVPTAVDSDMDEPVQLLAHCCSIITDLKISSDGKYVVTADRDFKIRISVFPFNPLKGAPEIWSYCLGHTSFVTCTAFVGPQNNDQKLLISGGGDSTVRLWDYENGKMLCSFSINDIEELEETEQNGSTETKVPRAVIGLGVSPDKITVAVLIERFAGVLLLKYDESTKRIKHFQNVVLAGRQEFPTSVAFDVSGKLWLVSGAAEFVESGDRVVTPEQAAAAEARAHAVARVAVAHVRVFNSSTSEVSGGVVEDNNSEADVPHGSWKEESLPGGDAALLALQGCLGDAGEVAMAAEAAELAMKKLMSKRQYTIEQRDNRKRFRNDKKIENNVAKQP